MFCSPFQNYFSYLLFNVIQYGQSHFCIEIQNKIFWIMIIVSDACEKRRLGGRAGFQPRQWCKIDSFGLRASTAALVGLLMRRDD